MQEGKAYELLNSSFLTFSVSSGAAGEYPIGIYHKGNRLLLIACKSQEFDRTMSIPHEYANITKNVTFSPYIFWTPETTIFCVRCGFVGVKYLVLSYYLHVILMILFL